MLISSLTSVCRHFNFHHGPQTLDELSTAVPLVLPDSWSSLTQLRSFYYRLTFPAIGGPLPSSWSKLENISQIYAYGPGEYNL